MRTYSELTTFHSFSERLEYLMLNDRVSDETFGPLRYINQQFYTSTEWKRAREEVIVRDYGCDLGMMDRPIRGKIIVHHMNPIRPDTIIHNIELALNTEYLICVSMETHNAIHFMSPAKADFFDLIIRRPGDTILW